jgi:hypothetical protein
MKTKSTLPIAALFALCQTIAPNPVSARVQDPALPDPSTGASPTRLLDLALEGRAELELTNEQAARLEAFRTGSLDRTAAAREVIATWREEMLAERDALADSAGLGPRERRRMLSAIARPTAEVREALRLVRDESEAAVEELRGTLTVNQMSALREIAMDEFPRLARGGRDRIRGTAPGFGPRSGPRFGPSFGPRFGPGAGFGPRDGYGFGPDEFPRGFRR